MQLFPGQYLISYESTSALTVKKLPPPPPFFPPLRSSTSFNHGRLRNRNVISLHFYDTSFEHICIIDVSPIFYIFLSTTSFVSLSGKIPEWKVEHGKLPRRSSILPPLLPDWSKFAQGKDVDVSTGSDMMNE